MNESVSDYLFYNPHGSSFETCARIGLEYMRRNGMLDD
jgi:hypothetical protein